MDLSAIGNIIDNYKYCTKYKDSTKDAVVTGDTIVTLVMRLLWLSLSAAAAALSSATGLASTGVTCAATTI
jgi:hypothetical protein